MFFNDFVQRRLAALLLPWLRREPELELKLGFLRSHVIARDLSLDTSVLNQSLDESSGFSFKEFKVDELSLRISYWSVPTFTVEVSGVHVALSPREMTEEAGSRRKRKATDTSFGDMKKLLAEIDPEGSALHNAMEKIGTSSSSNQTSSLLYVILQRCHFLMNDIHLEVQIPISNESFCLLEAKELNAKSQYIKCGCFLSGLISSIFVPLKESSFTLDLIGFELGIKTGEYVTCVISSVDLFTCMKLEDHQLIEFDLKVEEISFSFSALDILIISAINTNSSISNESKHTRNGSQLWKLAANRISSLVSTPRLSWHKLVTVISLWLCYLHAYESLLLVVGYPGAETVKRSAKIMSTDDALSRDFKNKWKTISGIERKLPAHAIAKAWRIARYRTALNVKRDENHLDKSLGNSHHKFFPKILLRLALFWNIICAIFCSIINVVLRKVLEDHPNVDEQSRVIYGDPCPQCILSLNIRKISFNLSPVNASQLSVGRTQLPGVRISYSELHALLFSIDTLFLTYRGNIYEQYFSFSCGQLKVISSSTIENGSSSNGIKKNQKGHWERKIDDAKAILWSEPANPGNGLPNNAERSSIPFLENLLRQIWVSWHKSCMKLKGCPVQILEKPWILCEIKVSLMDQGLKSMNSGSLKCTLIVGKLNLVLGYISMVSITLLLRQIQGVHGGRRTKVPLCHQVAPEDLPMMKWDDCYNSYLEKMFILLPEKHIQIGVFINGPHIQISVEKEVFFDKDAHINHMSRQEDIHLAVDVDNIEFAVFPNSKFDTVESSASPALGDAEPECLTLTEPPTLNIPHCDNQIYSCRGEISLCIYLKLNGLNAFFKDSSETQRCPIILLKPIIVQLSSLRKDCHSFSTAVVAFSAALQGTFIGLALSLYMDELFVSAQVVFGLVSAASHAFSGDLFGGVNFLKFTREKFPSDTKSEETIVTSAIERTSVSTLFSVHCTFNLKSMNMVLHYSRENSVIDNTTFSAANSRKLAVQSVPEYGIWYSIDTISIELICKEMMSEVLIEFSEICSIIFRGLSEIETISDQFQFRNMLLQSQTYLYEIYISLLTFVLRFQSPQNVITLGSVSNQVGTSGSGGKVPFVVQESPSAVYIDSSKVQSSNFDHISGISSNVMEPALNQWLLTKVSISEIYMTGCKVKNILIRERNSNMLEFSLTVGGEYQTITCQIQGGSIFLEATMLPKFIQCVASYHQVIRNILHVPSSMACLLPETCENVALVGGHQGEDTLQQVKWEQVETFIGNFSQLSLVLVDVDESGTIQELVFESNCHLNLEMADMNKKLSFQLSHLSMLSQILHKTVGERSSDTQIPHFSPVVSNDLSGQFVRGVPISANQSTDGAQMISDYTSHSSPSVFAEYSSRDGAQDLNLSPQHYILKQCAASISAEKSVPGNAGDARHLNQAWVGSGSISGFDMIISLREIQMLLSTIESLSGVFSKGSQTTVEQRPWFVNQESESYSRLEETVPDGAIVAIQDVHQHMYMAVGGVESNYSLNGALHYSLVGERSLFRVKYHKERRWKSSVMWFSLISLYAKSGSGEPLRLNYHQGSCFVDISSTSDNGCALWRMLSCKPETFEGDIELESYNLMAKNTFYLVNKKNKNSVAFIDGVPEFVTSPGNPFKWKVFHDISLVHDVVQLDDDSMGAFGREQNNSHANGTVTSAQNGRFPHIVISIDRISLTIVHELIDTKENFPLLQGSISSSEFILQILSAKARVMSSLNFGIRYFDAQRNLWDDFIHPVEVCLFYRSRYKIQGSETVSHGVPVHLYARIKELRISITELSLDILLFVIEKLNLGGPYAITSSRIFANCCKVDNQSSLDLLCQFYGNENVKLLRKQSSSVILRHLALVNQPPEATYVSIQLAERNALFTMPIHLSLLEAGALAWRTRIVSPQNSKTYPGPFIVVDITREIEDGLLIAVSPLLRIHNETEFSMELSFQRPQHKETQSASAMLKPGDTLDDSTAAFDAINLSGGTKKALMSLSVGKFLFSFRPEIADEMSKTEKLSSVEWSEYLEGGKAVRISGLFDKLSYKIRKVFSAEPVKCSFSTAHCSVKSDDENVADIHFLIQCIGRDVPLLQPDNLGYPHGNRTSPVAFQEQKEIFLLPTVRISNLLTSEIHVLLTDMEPSEAVGCSTMGKQATITCGSTVDLYANPTTIYFTITLTAFNSRCKPVNSCDWVKKLQKQKSNVHYLDVNLDFGAGKYFAILRLSRGHRGTLEAAVFTSYTVENDTDFPLFCFASNQKPLSRGDVEKLDFSNPVEIEYLFPPKSTRSWFMKYNKVRLKLLSEKASEFLLDLDALSGLTEIALEEEDGSGVKHIAKLGMSLGPLTSKLNVPSQKIYLVPRYIVLNKSEQVVTIRQCYLEDDKEGMISVNSKQKIALNLRSVISKKKEVTVFENFLRKHRDIRDDSLEFIQFRPSEAGLGWSGPVCIASLGRFFLKFRRSLDISELKSGQGTVRSNSSPEFASVHVVEEGSSLVMHYHRPPIINLPYRIENCLPESLITYYQKDSSEADTLGFGKIVNYVWDDSTLPHKLVIQINDALQSREISLDKVRQWKPFYKIRQHRGLGLHLPQNKNPRGQNSKGESGSMGIENMGYEVYADGPTRVLRICELCGRHKESRVVNSSGKTRLRISHFAIHLLERAKQDNAVERSVYTPIIVTRLENINLDSVFTDQQMYNQLRVQSLIVDQKWVGAHFAAMLRRHQSDYGDTNDYVLCLVVVLLSSSSTVRQVKYSSVVLQPLDLNLDEETLMRIVPFWRKSLSQTQSQQYYFDHFEIHPIKIIGSFMPDESYASYSSTQEMLRSLLHSVIKIPAMKNKNVELNGVLVTHALITISELFIKCAQHYSWYTMRAIYIAKGSPMLPPAFASVFDDLASSSLDVFFDPSRVLINLPGLTIGTFKLISKCINNGKGFSGTKRYFGDLGKTVKTAGSNILFAAVTEISDSVLKGAETSGFNGIVSGFHQGILKLAMEPSLLGSVVMKGGSDRKIKLDRNPGVDELYIEGYLQAMLDTIYKQEYLSVRVIEDQVFLKNLPPNSSLIDEIMDRVKGFLVSKALLKGDSSTASRSLRHLRGQNEWRIGPTVLTLCEHLFVSFTIRMLRKQVGKLSGRAKWTKKLEGEDQNKSIVVPPARGEKKGKLAWKWEIGKFVLSGIVAYIDGRLCRCIPNPIARRVVSGFLLSFLDTKIDDKE